MCECRPQSDDSKNRILQEKINENEAVVKCGETDITPGESEIYDETDVTPEELAKYVIVPMEEIECSSFIVIK